MDLRSQALETGILILVKAARGEPPGPDLLRDFDSVRASICPYRGLLHFREEDAPFFFGREAAISEAPTDSAAPTLSGCRDIARFHANHLLKFIVAEIGH